MWDINEKDCDPRPPPHFPTTPLVEKHLWPLWASVITYSVCGTRQPSNLSHVQVSEAESKRKTWCMGPYTGVDYNNLILCQFQSRLQHIYHVNGQPPMPESTLPPGQGLWIWPLNSREASVSILASLLKEKNIDMIDIPFTAGLFWTSIR